VYSLSQALTTLQYPVKAVNEKMQIVYLYFDRAGLVVNKVKVMGIGTAMDTACLWYDLPAGRVAAR